MFRNIQVSHAIANAHVIGSQSTSLSTEKDKKYLQLKKILKGMSLHDAAFFLYECRGRLEKESKIG